LSTSTSPSQSGGVRIVTGSAGLSGSIALVTGDSTNQAGQIIIATGSSENAGTPVSISSGHSKLSKGGNIELKSGVGLIGGDFLISAGQSESSSGGSIYLDGGDSFGVSQGGSVHLTGGDANDLGGGGSLKLTGGFSSRNEGGPVTISSGSSSDGLSGYLTITSSSSTNLIVLASMKPFPILSGCCHCDRGRNGARRSFERLRLKAWDLRNCGLQFSNMVNGRVRAGNSNVGVRCDVNKNSDAS
jgi:hypothetical protein